VSLTQSSNVEIERQLEEQDQLITEIKQELKEREQK